MLPFKHCFWNLAGDGNVQSNLLAALLGTKPCFPHRNRTSARPRDIQQPLTAGLQTDSQHMTRTTGVSPIDMTPRLSST